MSRAHDVGLPQSAPMIRAAPLVTVPIIWWVAMALDLSIVRRAVTVRLESLLGVDFDGDMTVGEKVEWIDECVELFAKLS